MFAEYAQVACRQAEKELHTLRQPATTPALSRSPSPRMVDKLTDQERMEAISDTEGYQDNASEGTSDNPKSVLIRGLSEAAERWKESSARVSCGFGSVTSILSRLIFRLCLSAYPTTGS